MHIRYKLFNRDIHFAIARNNNTKCLLFTLFVLAGGTPPAESQSTWSSKRNKALLVNMRVDFPPANFVRPLELGEGPSKARDLPLVRVLPHSVLLKKEDRTSIQAPPKSLRLRPALEA